MLEPSCPNRPAGGASSVYSSAPEFKLKSSPDRADKGYSEMSEPPSVRASAPSTPPRPSMHDDADHVGRMQQQDPAKAGGSFASRTAGGGLAQSPPRSGMQREQVGVGAAPVAPAAGYAPPASYGDAVGQLYSLQQVLTAAQSEAASCRLEAAKSAAMLEQLQGQKGQEQQRNKAEVSFRGKVCCYSSPRFFPLLSTAQLA